MLGEHGLTLGQDPPQLGVERRAIHVPSRVVLVGLTTEIRMARNGSQFFEVPKLKVLKIFLATSAADSKGEGRHER
ncbi:MAG: hypothetical protein WB820_19105 [Rhodoplanes sp.]